MKYLVFKENETLCAMRYEGSFDTFPKDNLKFFKNLASKFGCSELLLQGERFNTQPNKNVIELTGTLQVIPGVYIKGQIISSKTLDVPFINNEILKEHLTTVDDAPGLMVPKFLKKYIQQEDNMGTEFHAPACVYKGEVVSTFPSNLAALYATDSIVLTMYRGVKCLYCADSFDSKKILDYCHSAHLSHFVSSLELYPELASITHVNMDEHRTIFYLTGEMKEIESGVFKCEDMLITNTWAGSIVDTVKHEIR